MFGRNLKRSEGSRGPPGVGFKVTADGQFDLEKKRLCNLAAPEEPNDAVNLHALQLTLREEIKKVVDGLQELDDIIEAHRDEIDKKFNRIDREIQTIKGVIMQINQNIHSLDSEE